jgi:hypothetical protein
MKTHQTTQSLLLWSVAAYREHLVESTIGGPGAGGDTDPSSFVASRVDQIVESAVTAMAKHHFSHYERLGREASSRRVRELFDRVIDAVRTRNLTDVLAYAEHIGNERYDSGFDFVEVRSAFNLLEAAIWQAILDGYPPIEQGAALGLVATIFGAAKDKLASTYLSRVTETHMPSLDLGALFRGTQNTGAA